jgi:hypothetical protein
MKTTDKLDLLENILGFLPSEFFNSNVAPQDRQNKEIIKWALERLACVAYLKVFEKNSALIDCDSFEFLQNEKRNIALLAASKSLDVSVSDLEDWSRTVHKWSEDEAFYALFLDIAAFEVSITIAGFEP